jgi:hypothetical protein
VDGDLCVAARDDGAPGRDDGVPLRSATYAHRRRFTAERHRCGHTETNRGVRPATGTVDGRPVCVFSQDATVFGGALGEVYGEKIVKVMDVAMKIGCPVIGINDGGAGRRSMRGSSSPPALRANTRPIVEVGDLCEPSCFGATTVSAGDPRASIPTSAIGGRGRPDRGAVEGDGGGEIAADRRDD